jgi:hypothetical protein
VVDNDNAIQAQNCSDGAISSNCFYGFYYSVNKNNLQIIKVAVLRHCCPLPTDAREIVSRLVLVKISPATQSYRIWRPSKVRLGRPI